MSVAIWLGTTLLVGVTVALLGWVAVQSRRQALEGAEHYTANIVRAIHQSTARAFEAGDLLIRAVSARLETDRPEAIQALVADLLAAMPRITGMTVLDGKTGQVMLRYTTTDPLPREVEEESFVESAHTRADGEANGEPTYSIALARPAHIEATDRWVLGVSRRVPLKLAPYEAVVIAHLDLTYFMKLASGMKLGSDGVISLFRKDGVLLLRSARTEGAIGTSYANTDLFRQLLKAPAGTYETISVTENITRIISYQHHEALPLIIMCGLGKDEFLGRWREQMKQFGALSAGMILVVLGLSLWLSSAVRRRDHIAATLTATLDHMDQGLVMVDDRGVVQVYNKRAADLLGVPEERLRSKPRIEALRDHQLANGDVGDLDAAERIWATSEQARRAHYTSEGVRADGTVLEVTSVPLKGGGAVRTYTDVTTRRAAEAAVAESERRYRLLADSSSDVIMLKRLDGRRTYISPACRAILGYEPEEFLGLATDEIVHPDDCEEVKEVFRNLSPVSPRATHVHRLKHKAGHYVWVELVLSLVIDEQGELTYLGAIRDVSERQRQASELRAAKEAAEGANRAKSDFLASMSHEIRTPLNSIIGFTGVLLDRPDLPPDDRRKLQVIQGSGSALLTLVNDILDFSKIEAGQVELDPQPFSLPRLVEDTVDIIRGMAAKKEVEIRVSLTPSAPPLIVGDSDRLRQVLLNFLNNAVKFTRKGRVTLRVDHLGTVGSAERLRFSVHDTGIGIPKDKQDRLFERFSQVDGSIRREFGGTGLGLAICKRLVALMGGQIGVESEPGVGSTFWFEASFARGEALQVHEACLSAAATRNEARPARILLAEDLDVNQELAKLILTKGGHQVDVVQNGAEALQAVQVTPYDLVLMDVHMPVMDGITAVERIRALPGPVRHIPVIALTANVLPEQIVKFKAAGMNDHVGKPFRPPELLDAVQRCLQEKDGAPLVRGVA